MLFGGYKPAWCLVAPGGFPFYPAVAALESPSNTPPGAKKKNVKKDLHYPAGRGILPPALDSVVDFPTW
jgi:hypothetical protein